MKKHSYIVRIFWEPEVKDGTVAGFDNQWHSLSDGVEKN